MEEKRRKEKSKKPAEIHGTRGGQIHTLETVNFSFSWTEMKSFLNTSFHFSSLPVCSIFLLFSLVSSYYTLILILPS
jgi:hypothetical protein